MGKTRTTTVLPDPELSEFQSRSIELFVRATAVFSVPRSIGQVYGLLFATPRPLNLDELTASLRASRGGTFEAVKWLVNVGAVERVRLPGVRKDHFLAELNLRKLAAGYLRLKVEPHIENGTDHIRELEEAATTEGPESVFHQQRLNKIRSWHRVLSDLLPMIKDLAKEN
jgi:HTH-type transcriptional regulator, glycine betaine synthesis regulator